MVSNKFPLRHHPHWPLLWSDPQAVTQLAPYKRSVILHCSVTSRPAATPFLFSHPVCSEEFVSNYTGTAVKWAASHPSCTSGCCAVGAVLLPTACIQPCHPHHRRVSVCPRLPQQQPPANKRYGHFPISGVSGINSDSALEVTAQQWLVEASSKCMEQNLFLPAIGIQFSRI